MPDKNHDGRCAHTANWGRNKRPRTPEGRTGWTIGGGHRGLSPPRQLHQRRALHRTLTAFVLKVDVDLDEWSAVFFHRVCDQREDLEAVLVQHPAAEVAVDAVELAL